MTSIGRVEDQVASFQTQYLATAPNVQESIQEVTATFMNQIRAEFLQNETLLGHIVTSRVNEILGECRGKDTSKAVQAKKPL